MSGMHIVHVVCTDAYAGVEKYVVGATRLSRHSGDRVTVLGGDAQVGADVHALGAAWHPAATMARAWRLLRGLRDADVWVSHMTKADAVAAVAARETPPRVSVRHFSQPRGSHRWARPLMDRIASGLSAEVAISHAVARYCGPRVEVIHTGVDVVPAAPREPLRMVLVAQRLESEKDTAVVLRAWHLARLEGWRLVIAGDGHERDALERLAQDLGIASTVDFLGFQADMGPWWARAAMLVAPTPREGLGLSVLEAMAQGVPVIASRAAGHLETVGGTDGAVMFEPGNAAALGAELRRLAADDDRRVTYGQRLHARQREHFDAAVQGRALRALLERVAHEGRR